MTICAVVVTYNRVALLERCLDALSSQTRLPDRILVVDNASTDNTDKAMSQRIASCPEHISYHRLDTNTGGAGGFAAGLGLAREQGHEWVWIMDDDAEPHADALEQLAMQATNSRNIYGSVAVREERTSWTTTLLDPEPHVVDLAKDIPDTARVQSLPFLGFMIHRELIDIIGLPDEGYFIAADDIEYGMRAQRAGAEIYIAGRSRIEHPRAETYIARLPGRDLICLRLPPWKRYYDTRNRLFIARAYYGKRLYTQTIPGSFVRLLACLLYERHRRAQAWAFFAGLMDGLLGRKGPRHLLWHISQ